LQFAIDGGAAADPVWSKTYDDNSWSAVLFAPAGAGAHSVSVYRSGQGTPDDTKSFGVQPIATLLGSGADAAYMNLSPAAAASYLESYSAHNRAAQWNDTGATQHPTKIFDTMSRWDGDTGNTANRLGLYHYLSDLGYPSLNFNSLSVAHTDFSTSLTAYNKFTQRIGVTFEVGQAYFGACAPLVSRLTGDFTVVAAHQSLAIGSTYPPWILTTGGLNYAAGVYDNYGVGTYRRGVNQISSGPKVNLQTVICYVLRYRVSDGLLELFYVPSDGTAASTYSNTAAPEALTFSGLQLSPYMGNMYSLAFFNSRFGGDLGSGDVGAALTHLVNRWAT
jgi:hypothetical protein